MLGCRGLLPQGWLDQPGSSKELLMKPHIRHITHPLASCFTIALVAGALGCDQEKFAPSTPDSGPELAAASAPLSFVQVSTGTFHSCGVTTEGRAYCWGANDKGQLGDGTTFINTSRTTPSEVIGGHRFRHVSL